MMITAKDVAEGMIAEVPDRHLLRVARPVLFHSHMAPRNLRRVLLGIAMLAGADSLRSQVNEGAQSDEYRWTMRALEQYRSLAANDETSILPSPKKPVEPGEHYAGIPRLTRLLSRVGDLPVGAFPTNSDLYDGEIVSAVRRFQSRHGLEPDGRIGKATFAQLNTPLSFRVRQLELGLERWQRLSYDFSRPAVMLNLPEFRLRAFNAGHIPELEMKIVIGRARRLRTPLLVSEIDAVIFRPPWNVPLSIQRNELISDIMRDPSYISKNDFELVTLQDVVVTEGTTSKLLAQLRAGRLRLRQRPGPKNALGLVKFVFPNEYNIYMHDTPAKSLFARARRDFSHGCIRLERAEDFAEWVLRKDTGWSKERIGAAMQEGESITVQLKQSIPVTTIYVTAVVFGNGEVHFFEDIYGEDAALEKELAEGRTTTDESGQRPRE